MSFTRGTVWKINRMFRNTNCAHYDVKAPKVWETIWKERRKEAVIMKEWAFKLFTLEEIQEEHGQWLVIEKAIGKWYRSLGEKKKATLISEELVNRWMMNMGSEKKQKQEQVQVDRWMNNGYEQAKCMVWNAEEKEEEIEIQISIGRKQLESYEKKWDETGNWITHNWCHQDCLEAFTVRIGWVSSEITVYDHRPRATHLKII